MSGSEITQSNNSAGDSIVAGDLAKGDLYKGNVIVQVPPRPESALGRLFRHLKTQAADDPGLTKYICDLEIYTRTVEHETIIGLDGKLEKAGRLDQLYMAKHMKEAIYANLRRNMFSKTFQTIYATLMAKVYEEFDIWVRPAIVKGLPRDEIDRIVNEKVVKPIVDELEACEHFDGVALSTVRGMIYFLTGNCHLVWH